MIKFSIEYVYHNCSIDNSIIFSTIKVNVMTNNAAVLPVNNNISVSPYFATVAVTGAAYTMMELIRHGLIEGYLVPWLTSMGLSAAMVTYLSYAMVVIGIAAIAYLIYKMFIAKEE